MSSFTREFDILVLGSGIAGLTFALKAAGSRRVAILTKKQRADSNTNWAQGGIAAVFDGHDSFASHVTDTLRAGAGLCDRDVVRAVVREAPERVRELATLGVPFNRNARGFALGREGGHSRRRIVHASDFTGRAIESTLLDRVRSHRNIELLEDQVAVDLILDSRLSRRRGARRDTVWGAYVMDRRTGRIRPVTAAATVLATGGCGKVYLYTTNPDVATGDGLAMAYRAGASIANMEFVQFHPTGMVWPPSVRGILVTESVRGDGGVLRNSNGERFMFNYIPEVFKKQYADNEAEADRWYTDQNNNRRPPELLPRDEVARAINSEVKAGRGTPHGGVYLDVSTRLPAEEIKRRLPSMWHQFYELAGVDITKEPMEVGPTCHYVMGGIDVEPDTGAAIGVPGLFAAGEVAAGLHGSNRLGGNSLSDLLVFGRRAGDGAAAYVKANGENPPTEASIKKASEYLNAPFKNTDGENPYTIHAELQQTTNDLVGIIRIKHELEESVTKIAELRKRAVNAKAEGGKNFNPGFHLALDLDNMLLVSEAIARCALQREESRGGHTREDFPKMDPTWRQVNSITTWDGNAMTVVKQALPAIPAELAGLFDKEELKKYLTEEELNSYGGAK